MRRKLHNQILKNQYSYWAGMYVKRLPGGTASFSTAGRPSVEEVLLANKSTKETIEKMMQGGPSFYSRSSSTSVPLVDFGDPRSLT